MFLEPLLSFIVAALCVQQAVSHDSHPLERRISVYIISYLFTFLLVT